MGRHQEAVRNNKCGGRKKNERFKILKNESIIWNNLIIKRNAQIVIPRVLTQKGNLLNWCTRGRVGILEMKNRSKYGGK